MQRERKPTEDNTCCREGPRNQQNCTFCRHRSYSRELRSQPRRCTSPPGKLCTRSHRACCTIPWSTDLSTVESKLQACRRSAPRGKACMQWTRCSVPPFRRSGPLGSRGKLTSRNRGCTCPLGSTCIRLRIPRAKSSSLGCSRCRQRDLNTKGQ